MPVCLPVLYKKPYACLMLRDARKDNHTHRAEDIQLQIPTMCAGSSGKVASALNY